MGIDTAKLNIEMTMASLIVKLAQTGRSDAYFPNSHSHSTPAHPTSQLRGGRNANEREVALKTFTESRVRASFSNGSDDPQQAPFPNGIQRTREFQITVHHNHSGSLDESKEYAVGDHDEAWLTRNTGHPRDTATSDKSTTTKDS
jgi:hypothetical protein